MERLTHRRDSDGVACPNIKESEVLTKWGDWVQNATEKLCAYEDAEEQGLLIRLPCKVGDKVYKLWYEPCHFGNTYPDSMDCDGCEDACDLKRVVVECEAPSVEWIIHNMLNKHPFAYATKEEAKIAFERKD